MLNFKGIAIFAITIYICHAFSIQLEAMFVYGSIEDHMFDFLTGFFFYLTRNVFYALKIRLLRINR